MSEQKMTQQQEDLLMEAKFYLLRQMPYFGIFLIGVPLIADWSIPTACTNHREIRFNPDFVLGGTPVRPNARPRSEVVFIKAHEVLHTSFKHGLRMSFREPKLWNVACDYAINIILHDGQVGTYPEPDIDPKTGKPYPKLLDEQFRGWSAEAIYDHLEKERQKQGGGQSFKHNGSGGTVVIDLRSDDVGGLGSVEKPTNKDGSGLTPAQKAELEREIDSKTSQAAASAKSQGKLPAGLERFIKAALKPEVDWRERLRQFVGRNIPVDMTWSRPRKKFLWMNDMYLPSSDKRGVGKIVGIFDTSGSIDFSTGGEGAQFAAELKAIHEDVIPEELHVMYCDAEVAGYDIFTPADEFVVKPRGGGGTDFRPPFTKIEEEGIDVQCAIYLTDMYGEFPSKPPPYPVLWVATSDVVAPWGETIRIMKG